MSAWHGECSISRDGGAHYRCFRSIPDPSRVQASEFSELCFVIGIFFSLSWTTLALSNTGKQWHTDVDGWRRAYLYFRNFMCLLLGSGLVSHRRRLCLVSLVSLVAFSLSYIPLQATQCHPKLLLHRRVPRRASALRLPRSASTRVAIARTNLLNHSCTQAPQRVRPSRNLRTRGLQDADSSPRTSFTAVPSPRSPKIRSTAKSACAPTRSGRMGTWQNTRIAVTLNARANATDVYAFDPLRETSPT